VNGDSRGERSQNRQVVFSDKYMGRAGAEAERQSRAVEASRRVVAIPIHSGQEIGRGLAA
jgi:hypothetical protein